MPLHWPHESLVQVSSASHVTNILTWCHACWGDPQYQHWTSEYVRPLLKIKFSTQDQKVMFDCVWQGQSE